MPLCAGCATDALHAYQATALSPLWAESQPFLDRHALDPPYWAFAWPGGVGLASWLLMNPTSVRGRRVVDFGSGSGLCAFAALRAGARQVVAVDRDPLARTAIRVNARRQGLIVEVEGAAPTLEAGDVLLAGDVYYEAEPARAFIAWFIEADAAGVTVITGDPGRSYAPTNFHCLAELDAPTSEEIEGGRLLRTRILSPRIIRPLVSPP